MKKAWKKIAALIAVTCLALCGLILSACGGDSQADYSVSLTRPSGAAVVDAKVIFTPDAKDKAAVEAVTDENGKCTVRLYTDMDYTVTADNLGNFILQTRKIHTKKGEDIELKVVLPITYTFEVTGPEGADLSNITVSYSATVDGERTPLGQTGEDGKLWAMREPTDGYAFITPPEGYVYNENYVTKCPYIMSSLRPQTITFELIRHEQLSLDTTMSGEEINAFQTESKNTVFKAMMESSVRNAYSFRKTADDAEAQKVYSFRAAEAGEYWVFANYAGEYMLSVSDNLNLNGQNALNSTSGSFDHFSVVCEEGTTYYLYAQADTAQHDFQFVIVSPQERNETLVTAEGDAELSILENLPAIIRFMPSVAGEYTFTTESDVKIEVISNSYVVDSSDNGTLKIEVTAGNLVYGDGSPSHISWQLRFTALDANPVYPLNINVHITRENIIEYTLQVKVVEVTEKLTKYEDQKGTLTAIGVNGTTGQIVKGADGYYHYGSENGAVVVIKLKGEIDVFYPEVKFEALDESYEFYRFHKSTDDEKHIYYHENYAKFLRGYLAYGDDKNASGEYYLKYVNSDGVYPLTDELITFLKLVADRNSSFFGTCVSTYTMDSLWLFSAYYYAE